MSKTKAKTQLLPFDAARYMTDDAAIAEYMTAVLETDNLDLLGTSKNAIRSRSILMHP
jgi:DNA-binding phage protein